MHVHEYEWIMGGIEGVSRMGSRREVKKEKVAGNGNVRRTIAESPLNGQKSAILVLPSTLS